MMLNTVFSPVGGVVIIAAVCLFLLVVRKSSVIVDRQRPNPALLFDPLAPETGSNSFPSGHVELTVGLSWAVWFRLRNSRWTRLTAFFCVLVPVTVAVSRIYVGVHYPSDVVASLLAASAAVFFLVLLCSTVEQI